MRRIRLTIAYDGTDYCGWQKQDGAPSVQETVEDAIRKLTGEQAEVIGASRTDSGVHALGQTAVFDTESPVPADRFVPALNSFLPDDIRITESEEVPESFHPRFDAHRKRYEYRIFIGNVCPPMRFRYVHHLREVPDVTAMQEAASYIVGTHDFTSFCAAGAQVKTKVRTVTSIQVEKAGDEIVIAVEGDGFLYNMIRIIAGTLVNAGLGRTKPAEIPGIITGMDRSLAGPTLPAKGLCLCKIWYC
ncbi:MAG: tRNA pseudouridine(38-40) synthase TruA [Lachnospiraceae bacterium]|nr:tRNA pseudouridine(38-40) synthase TruA [Lachnospiraceae bacterium]